MQKNRTGTLRRATAAFSLILSLAVLAPFAPKAHAESAVPQSAAQIKLSFAPIVKEAAPAVVNVYARRVVAQRQVSPFFNDPFFRRFFGDQGGFGAPRQRVERSLGSGVIISADGIIITNHHVIKDADEVRVALSDRREFDCDIVLDDERTDLAVLKIKDGTGDFPHLKFGDSDKLEVGDIVLAIGNPFGVGQTVTQGIVSAVARTHVGVSDYQFFIQTDASINPGNSGGALVDMSGNLVGINSAIYSRSGGSNGIGFAIPVNMVKLIAEAAKHGGKVRRPWIGASMQAVTADIAEGMGLDRPRGVLVTRIAKGSPAAKAGLKVGDLVLAVDGTQVEDPNAFGYRLATKKLGGKAELDVMSDGREHMLSIALEAAPETVPRDTREIGGRSPFTGATVENLSPAVAEELSLPSDEEGVVVKTVAPGSPAERVGLQAGDIIASVNQEAVKSTRGLASIAGTEPYVWRVEVSRDGRTLRFAVRG
ncbi:DegQ family serine endoprotease [Breoghania sp. JC706]|uniref:DegQ family serine endoprotease n=1 Tax=Breoghania sp. JC706 TaxID=3117732 RepID=UPI003009FE60